MKSNKKILFLAQGALIAALYVVLTYLANLLGIANGVIQVRFSEALTILPFFTPAAIPGLTIGCLLANILTGCALPDIIFGTLATLIGAVGTWAIAKALRKNKAAAWLSPLPPIIANAIIVPLLLLYAYGVGPLWFSFITVTAGEVVSCGLLGMLLLFALRGNANIFRMDESDRYVKKATGTGQIK